MLSIEFGDLILFSNVWTATDYHNSNLCSYVFAHGQWGEFQSSLFF